MSCVLPAVRSCRVKILAEGGDFVTEAHMKELISRAYVNALAARVGMTVATSSLDYGFDGTFKDIEYNADTKEYSETGFGIDFQLKATINAIPDNGVIKYSLEVKNYHKLIQSRVGTPRILIVYSMPHEKDLWLTVNAEETTFRKCAWWCSLKGQPEVDNKERVVVNIPFSQQLTPEKLAEMMKRVKEGVAL